MFGRRLINTQQGGGCTTDTLQILGDTSCIATYRLNGDATDLSGNYNGTATSVTYVSGLFGDAGSFNGSSTSFLDLSALDSFFYNSGNFLNFTISLWFKSSSVGVYYIFIDYNGSFKSEITLNENGKIKVGTRYGATDVIFTSVDSYDDNTWHHIVVTGNASTLERKTYIDNTHLNTMSVSAAGYTVAGGDNRTTIGNLYAAGVQYGGLNGSIDQVRIFNKAISATEVTTLYNEVAC